LKKPFCGRTRNGEVECRQLKDWDGWEAKRGKTWALFTTKNEKKITRLKDVVANSLISLKRGGPPGRNSWGNDKLPNEINLGVGTKPFCHQGSARSKREKKGKKSKRETPSPAKFAGMRWPIRETSSPVAVRDFTARERRGFKPTKPPENGEAD